MNKEKSIEFLNTLFGINGFQKRPNFELPDAFKDLLRISNELSITVPQKFANIYARFNLQELLARKADISQEVTCYWAYSSKKSGIPNYLFEGFLNADEIISARKEYSDFEELLFEGGLLKIGRTPWVGGIYLGVGKQNNEHIYWVKLDVLAEDISPEQIGKVDFEGINLIANDINGFIEGLHAYFPEESGEDTLPYL
ncbi:MAG: hypothetical protein ABIQ93_05400 [Saprospiraceae bacterium]